MARIVVIDDSAVVLEIAKDLLSESGHEVITFTSSERALQTLKTQAVDLIITDIYMPDADGLEVIRDARRICSGTPIIAMSGMTGKMNMLNVAHHLGACRTLLKPFSRAELFAAVSSALESGTAGAGDRPTDSEQPGDTKTRN